MHSDDAIAGCLKKAHERQLLAAKLLVKIVMKILEMLSPAWSDQIAGAVTSSFVSARIRRLGSEANFSISIRALGCTPAAIVRKLVTRDDVIYDALNSPPHADVKPSTYSSRPGFAHPKRGLHLSI
jgi:hypothetical protein